jgi:hypothetical protein
MAAMLKTQKLIVLLLISEGPNVFEAPCSFNTTREVTFEAGVVETPSVDCDDPDAPAWIARAIDTFSSTISGAGTLHTGDLETWQGWFSSGLPKLVRVKLDVPANEGGGDWQGEYVLSSMGLAKEGRGYATFSAEMQSNGPVVWTDAS